MSIASVLGCLLALPVNERAELACAQVESIGGRWDPMSHGTRVVNGSSDPLNLGGFAQWLFQMLAVVEPYDPLGYAAAVSAAGVGSHATAAKSAALVRALSWSRAVQRLRAKPLRSRGEETAAVWLWRGTRGEEHPCLALCAATFLLGGFACGWASSGGSTALSC